MSVFVRSSNWPFQWPLVAIALAALLYFLGGRMSATPAAAVKRWRGASFYCGLVVLALAVDSPIDAYADRLFWVHMVQHVLLMMVAPPLLLLGRPWPRIVRPVPLAVRRPVARAALAGPTLASVRGGVRRFASPAVAFVVFNGTLVAWHVPGLYDATLRNGLVHDLEHALFFSTAMLFWVHLLPAATGRPQLSDGGRVAYGVGAVLVSWILAVVLATASRPLYGAYAALAHRPGGLSALADQQIAAGIMWVPGSLAYFAALTLAVIRWLEPSAARRARGGAPTPTTHLVGR